jgi:hypothetical protein
MDGNDRQPVVLMRFSLVVCLACDFLVVPILRFVPISPILGFPLLLGIVGCVLAQGCLLAAWLAWGDQPFWQRFTRHWTFAAILYLVWVAGLAASHSDEFARVSSFVGLSVPLVSIAAQSPLWIARQVFGWRLIRGDRSINAGPAPLSIRDLMVATMMVALALAPARLAPSPDDKEFGGLWIIIFVMASAVSTIALMPASALLLRTQQFQRGMVFAGLYAAFWLGLLWLVILVARNTGLFHVPPLAVVLGFSCLIISFAATVVFAAAAARAFGYRLVWGRFQRQSAGR